MNDKNEKSQLLNFQKKDRASSQLNQLDDQDEGLKHLLQRWQVSGPSDSFDRKMISSFRTQNAARGFWRRVLTTSVRIPVSAAAMVIVLLATGSYVALRAQKKAIVSVPPQEPSVKTVEVPVVKERIVYKLIYAKRISRVKGKSAKGKNAIVKYNFAAKQGLSGFKPVDQLKVRPIKENDSDEK